MILFRFSPWVTLVRLFGRQNWQKEKPNVDSSGYVDGQPCVCHHSTLLCLPHLQIHSWYLPCRQYLVCGHTSDRAGGPLIQRSLLFGSHGIFLNGDSNIISTGFIFSTFMEINVLLSINYRPPILSASVVASRESKVMKILS